MKLLPTLLATVVLASSALAGAPAAVTADIKNGLTTITLDSNLTAALDVIDLSFKKSQPAQINPGKGQLRFPAVGGFVDLVSGLTEIINSGGISFAHPISGTKPTKYDTVTLLDPIIEITAPGTGSETAVITAVVVVKGTANARATVFKLTNLGLTAPVTLPPNKKIALKSVGVALSAEAAAALNTAFTPAVPFTEGQTVGTAEIGVKFAGTNL